MTALGEFLEAGAARQREPGVWDCCAFPAEWAMAAGCPDPMAEWRGAYTTELAGEHLAEQDGGLVALFDRGMAAAGIPAVDDAWRPGDIAVVELLGRQAGAVFSGRRWAFVAARGLAFASLDAECVLRVWRPREDG